ncbi:MAG: PEP-CTERM sorting domain-containing protein [Planctomycetes bacterium]|nr:PEP-CTERM sorting domain-containing protein [Planctomycetota bacterium]
MNPQTNLGREAAMPFREETDRPAVAATRRFERRWLAAGALALALGAGAAPATSIFTWTSATAGSGGGIDATVTSTVNAGVLTTQTFSPTDPGFLGAFGDPISALHYRSPVSDDPADILSTITFSAALPTGAVLLIGDLDVWFENVTVAADGAPPVLLSQVESTAGATSAFPSYDSLLGILASTAGPTGLNDREVSIFDISGISSLQIDFAGGALDSGVFAAIALPDPGATVPEPGTLLLLAFGTGAAAAMSRRRRNGAIQGRRRGLDS